MQRFRRYFGPHAASAPDGRFRLRGRSRPKKPTIFPPSEAVLSWKLPTFVPYGNRKRIQNRCRQLLPGILALQRGAHVRLFRRRRPQNGIRIRRKHRGSRRGESPGPARRIRLAAYDRARNAALRPHRALSVRHSAYAARRARHLRNETLSLAAPHRASRRERDPHPLRDQPVVGHEHRTADPEYKIAFRPHFTAATAERHPVLRQSTAPVRNGEGRKSHPRPDPIFGASPPPDNSLPARAQSDLRSPTAPSGSYRTKRAGHPDTGHPAFRRRSSDAYLLL